MTRYTKVVDGGKTKLSQLPATQFQNGYSHCINKVHKVRRGEASDADKPIQCLRLRQGLSSASDADEHM